MLDAETLLGWMQRVTDWPHYGGRSARGFINKLVLALARLPMLLVTTHRGGACRRLGNPSLFRRGERGRLQQRVGEYGLARRVVRCLLQRLLLKSRNGLIQQSGEVRLRDSGAVGLKGQLHLRC